MITLGFLNDFDNARDPRRRRFALAIFGVTLLLALTAISPCAAINVNFSTGNLSYTDAQGTLRYRLYLPPGYNASTDNYPLVTFLHGSGESGTDNGLPSAYYVDGLFNATQGGLGSQYKALLLVPQTDFGWWGTGNDVALDLIDQIMSTYRVDSRRLYLTGLSMGGYGTFDMIQTHPGIFAAAAPQSGGGDPDLASVIKDVPIWAFHGSSDGVVPVTYTDKMFDAIENAGGFMEYTRIDGLGHGGWDTFMDGTTYRNSRGQTLYQWMFSQSLPVPEPASLTLLFGAAAIGLAYGIKRFLA